MIPVLPKKTEDINLDIENLLLSIEAHQGLSAAYATLALLHPDKECYQIQLKTVNFIRGRGREELEKLMYERKLNSQF